MNTDYINKCEISRLENSIMLSKYPKEFKINVRVTDLQGTVRRGLGWQKLQGKGLQGLQSLSRMHH